MNAKQTDSGLVFDTVEVARKLGRTPETVRRWIERKYLPNAYRPPGGRWLIPESDVEAFLDRMSAG